MRGMNTNNKKLKENKWRNEKRRREGDKWCKEMKLKRIYKQSVYLMRRA